MMARNKDEWLLRVVLSVVIVTLLIVCAVIKIIYPSPLLNGFFFFISIVEIALAMGVAIFWNRWKMWAILALVFATWGGYSLYAAIFGLPCLCLGVAVTLPNGTSLIANILFAALCWVVIKGFAIPRKKAIKLGFFSLFLVAFGFGCASLLYYLRF